MIDKVRVATNYLGVAVCHKDGKLQQWLGSYFKEIPEVQLIEIENEYQKKLQEEPLKLMREERNKRLEECDWIMTVDVLENMSEEKVTEWKAYRKSLRDMPVTETPQLDENQNLVNVNWPTKPE